MKHPKTVDQVITILGGNAAVADLPCMSEAGISRNAVHNWRVQQKLPSKTYVALANKLRKLGFSAPLDLWGMIEP